MMGVVRCLLAPVMVMQNGHNLELQTHQYPPNAALRRETQLTKLCQEHYGLFSLA